MQPSSAAVTGGRGRPRLSICVATAAGWEAVEPCLRSFLDDGRRLGAEILVADGSGRPPPADPSVRESVTWRSYPEKSVFRLVSLNLREASGDIIVLTEDHCTARPGWLETILRAHREYPDAAAIGGAIQNGSRSNRLQWASYLMTQGAHMAPLSQGPSARIANEANISFKRTALLGIEDHPLGFMTIRHTRALADRGATLVSDDRILVDHHESIGWRATAKIHFDDGRTISGFRRTAMAGGDWVRIAAAPLLPLYRSLRVVRIAVGKGRAATLLGTLPWIVALEYCHGAGELVGYLRGAGRSPYGLR